MGTTGGVGRSGADIKGPGGHPWFKLKRENMTTNIMHLQLDRFCIYNMEGKPLLRLEEQRTWTKHAKYEISRIDPQSEEPIPLCKVCCKKAGKPLNNYDITLHAAMAAHSQFTMGTMNCLSPMRDQFTMDVNGDPV